MTDRPLTLADLDDVAGALGGKVVYRSDARVLIEWPDGSWWKFGLDKEPTQALVRLARQALTEGTAAEERNRLREAAREVVYWWHHPDQSPCDIMRSIERLAAHLKAPAHD